MKIRNIILIIMASVMLVSCSKNEPVQKRIDSIEIYHCSESSIPFEKYKIDFTSKEFTILVRGGFIDMVDEVKEGSPVIKALDEDSINNFLDFAQESGFEEWEKSYENVAVIDGHQWGITISFSDGTEKEITGSNAYPKYWDEMNIAFEELTGENVLHVSCSKNEPVQKRIDSIEIYHCSGSSIPFEKYKIDFTSKEFIILVRGGFIGMVNEVKRGSPVVKTLDQDSINNFLDFAQESGFEEWEKSYENFAVIDGHEWGITISFSDGTEKEITGSNAYPKSWDEMNIAFEELTGENVLLVKSNLIDN